MSERWQQRVPASVLALRQRGKAIDDRNKRIAEEARRLARLERMNAQNDGSGVARLQRGLASLEAALEEARRGDTLLKLDLASDQAIHFEMAAVYDDAEKRGARPPNKIEVVDEMKVRLRARNMTAKNEVIRRIAGQPEFAARRWQQGRHYKRPT